MTDPTLDWLRSEMDDARDVRERLESGRDFVKMGAKMEAWRHLPAALSVLDRIGTELARADMDALFDALDRLEEAAGPEVVEVLGELRDAALRRQQGREGHSRGVM